MTDPSDQEKTSPTPVSPESSSSSDDDEYAAREQAFFDKLVERLDLSDEKLDGAFDRWINRWDNVVEAETKKETPKDAKTKADEEREPESERARNLRPGRRRALLPWLY